MSPEGSLAVSPVSCKGSPAVSPCNKGGKGSQAVSPDSKGGKGSQADSPDSKGGKGSQSAQAAKAAKAFLQ